MQTFNDNNKIKKGQSCAGNHWENQHYNICVCEFTEEAAWSRYRKSRKAKKKQTYFKQKQLKLRSGVQTKFKKPLHRTDYNSAKRNMNNWMEHKIIDFKNIVSKFKLLFWKKKTKLSHSVAHKIFKAKYDGS